MRVQDRSRAGLAASKRAQREAAKAEGAPAKSPPRDFIMVQVDEAQRATFEAAAKEVGMPVSTWLRAMGMVAARKGV